MYGLVFMNRVPPRITDEHIVRHCEVEPSSSCSDGNNEIIFIGCKSLNLFKSDLFVHGADNFGVREFIGMKILLNYFDELYPLRENDAFLFSLLNLN
jgi:hypothetical protein